MNKATTTTRGMTLATILLCLLFWSQLPLARPSLVANAAIDSDTGKQAAMHNPATKRNNDHRVLLPIVSVPCSTTHIASDFNGQECGWRPIRGEWGQLDGYYQAVGNQNEWVSSVYQSDFGNFDYSVRIRRSGCEFCSTVLFFRGDATDISSDGLWEETSLFAINQEGLFSVWQKEVGESIRPLRYWDESDAIQAGDKWNTLRVVAFNNLLLFYVNDEVLWRGITSSFDSGYVGVGMYVDDAGGENRLQIDWVTLETISAGR